MIFALICNRMIFRGNWSDQSKAPDRPSKGFRMTIQEPNNVSGHIILEASVFVYNDSSYTYPSRNFHMYGIPVQNNYYFFSTPKLHLELEKASKLIIDAFTNPEINNSENIEALDKYIKKSLNHTEKAPIVASLIFCNVTMPSSVKTFDTSSGINGTITYDKKISFSATLINYTKFVREGKIFGVLIGFSILINFMAWKSLFSNFKSSTSLYHLSLGTFIMHISFDFSFALYFFDLTSTAFEFVNLFLFLFICTTTMFIVCMQLIALIWRAQNPGVDDELRPSFMNLIIGITSSMFLYSFSTSIVFQMPIITLTFMYSFFIPQILYTARTPGMRKGDEVFNILISLQRLIPLWYSTIYKNNVHETHSVVIGIVFTIYVLFQLSIMFLQTKYGGLFFLPGFAKPKIVDYLSERPPPHSECPICMCEIFDQEETAVTPCHHNFHRGCLARWLEEDMVCPICRAPLPPLT